MAGSADVKGAIPTLAALAGSIGDPAVRHVGTIGGSVANNDPAADYPSAVLALAATVHTNKRQIAADDYFTGLFTTALEEGEIVTKVAFKVPETSGYAKFRNPASLYPMAGVFVAKHKDGSVRVAVTGAGNDGVFRWAAAEQALSGNFSRRRPAGPQRRRFRHDGRHPRLVRIPRPPGRGHGAPRGEESRHRHDRLRSRPRSAATPTLPVVIPDGAKRRSGTHEHRWLRARCGAAGGTGSPARAIARDASL